MEMQNKILLLAALTFMSFIFVSKSQTQYEYAVVDYQPFDRVLQVSINGEVFHRSKIPMKEVKGSGDVNAVLKEIRKMNEEGWEVFQATTVAGHPSNTRGHIFYLRRKIE